MWMMLIFMIAIVAVIAVCIILGWVMAEHQALNSGFIFHKGQAYSVKLDDDCKETLGDVRC